MFSGVLGSSLMRVSVLIFKAPDASKCRAFNTIGILCESIMNTQAVDFKIFVELSWNAGAFFSG